MARKKQRLSHEQFFDCVSLTKKHKNELRELNRDAFANRLNALFEKTNGEPLNITRNHVDKIRLKAGIGLSPRKAKVTLPEGVAKEILLGFKGLGYEEIEKTFPLLTEIAEADPGYNGRLFEK